MTLKNFVFFVSHSKLKLQVSKLLHVYLEKLQSSSPLKVLQTFQTSYELCHNCKFFTFQWLELIPIRKRRLSDPDYDVPRPHRFLQLGNSKKNVADNSIPATRFFGPILPITSAEERYLIDTNQIHKFYVK